MSEGRITRRDFIRGTAWAALAAAVGLPAACTRAARDGVAGAGEAAAPAAGAERLAQAAQAAEAPAAKTSTVVLVRDPAAVGDNGQLNFQVIGRMIDEGLQTLLAADSPADAWRQIVKPGELVGIKSNVWQPLRTPPEVEQHIKQRVVEAGVPADKVRITDRAARRMLADCTALINVRPLRWHHWAGIGGCIKNYIMFSPTPYQYHPNSCESLAEAWFLPYVKGKTRVNILLALTPQFYGRGPHNFDPRWVWPYCGIFISRDPVAVDALGAELLRRKRIEFFGEDKPTTPTIHIAAAERKYGLGVADLSRIRIVLKGPAEGALLDIS